MKKIDKYIIIMMYNKHTCTVPDVEIVYYLVAM